MNKLIKFIAFLIVLAAGASFASAQESKQSTKPAREESAIRELVKKMEAGWNAKDVSREAQLYFEDVDYINSYGTFLKGRNEIAEGHRYIYSTIYKDTTLTLTIEKIRFLRPDAAIVHVFNSLKKIDKTSKGRMTLVVAKEGSEWKIAAQQITSIQESERR
ncbi:MAG TPA: SgcJ/EcaC family oxidoreductase [Pyrinomonadaceae bacterium]|nr:SgcJ/EcaC family oxidoreductase [Pyrinomonadaceae bacterium]